MAGLALLVAPPAAEATFPGADGVIAFHRSSNPPGNLELWWTTGAFEMKVSGGSGVSHSNAAYSADGLRLAFDMTQSGNSIGLVVARDGAGVTPVASLDPSGIGTPSWSPDDTKIVFTDDRIALSGQRELYVMNADGTNQVRIIDDGVPPNSGTSWSPDGSRIAYTRNGNIHLVNPDGTGDAPITSSGRDSQPNWSPDGTKIAFMSDREAPCSGSPCDREIFVVNADGSGETNITNTPVSVLDSNPSWSPTGAEIAFERFPVGVGATNVYRMASDGSGVTQVTTTTGFNPDWQPRVRPIYNFPKAATPLHVSLVPAYRVCQAPNRVHATPLAYNSCNPPTIASSTLTVGTPDANGNAANFTGSARYRVITGNPGTPLDEADVAFDVSLTDIRCAITSPACPDGPGSDYAGPLVLTSPPIQITDNDSKPQTGDGSGTGQLATLPTPFNCTATASTTIGASCSLSTTVEALLPNAVKEGHRALWETGPMHVRDAGPNGTGFGAGCPPACGDGDETLFLRQGIFIP
jgi:WD40 repeat protein